MAAEQSVDAGEDPRKGRGRKGRKATAIEATAWVKAGVRHTHPCGNGVYLQVTRPGVASWLFRFSVHGRRRDLGLGSYGDVKLSEAFAKAAEAALLVRAGRDPVAEKRGAKQAAAVEARAAEMNAAKAAAAALTFRDVALDYICDHRAAWENRQHRWQWEATLEKHVFPVIGGLHPSEITVDHVLQVLRPIWNTTNETASRVRGRIETILSVAKVRKLRSGENPAAWRDNLALLLPKPGDVKVRHHPALPWKRMPEFMRDAERRQGQTWRVVRFAALTAARSGEVRQATWGEVDLGERVWTVRAARMKAGRIHRVPLSDTALAVLAEVRGDADPARDTLIFPAPGGAPLSDMAATTALRKTTWVDAVGDVITLHGFRPTFRDWVAEATSHAGEIAEAALAHLVGDKVEAAYRRGDLFEKRRRLMTDWGRYCRPLEPAEHVVQLRREGAGR